MTSRATTAADPFAWNTPQSWTPFDDPPEYTQRSTEHSDIVYNRWSWSPPSSWAVDQDFANLNESPRCESSADGPTICESLQTEAEFPPDGEKVLARVLSEQCFVKWSIVVIRADGKLHRCKLPLIATVQNLEDSLHKHIGKSVDNWKLYLRESDGRELSLRPHANPAGIIKRRLEAAGYMLNPSEGFIQTHKGREPEFDFLPRFVFRNEGDVPSFDYSISEPQCPRYTCGVKLLPNWVKRLFTTRHKSKWLHEKFTDIKA